VALAKPPTGAVKATAPVGDDGSAGAGQGHGHAFDAGADMEMRGNSAETVSNSTCAHAGRLLFTIFSSRDANETMGVPECFGTRSDVGISI
jgi:hypothetical protein